MKTTTSYLLLHGWYGTSQENWFPWLKKKLESQGSRVFAPDLPNPIHPTPKEWLDTIGPYMSHLTQGTIIGHSLGAPLAISFICEHDLSIDHLVLVAPTFPEQRNIIDLSSYEGLIETQERFYVQAEDLEKLKKNCDKISIFLSKDDPYIPYNEAWKFYSQIPNIELHRFEDKGHFNADAGVTKFPEILELL